MANETTPRPSDKILRERDRTREAIATLEKEAQSIAGQIEVAKSSFTAKSGSAGLEKIVGGATTLAKDIGALRSSHEEKQIALAGLNERVATLNADLEVAERAEATEHHAEVFKQIEAKVEKGIELLLKADQIFVEAQELKSTMSYAVVRFNLPDFNLRVAVQQALRARLAAGSVLSAIWR